MSLPSDHYESTPETVRGGTRPMLGPIGWIRWVWRQLTSMRTALFLLLLLAVAAVPGSMIPQREADPNGVTQYFTDHPTLAPILDKVQLFDVYSSVWFSAIYILLFISLIGCIIPRVRQHLKALRAAPPRTPVRLTRMPGYRTHDIPAARAAGSDHEGVSAVHVVERAQVLLKRARYRTELHDDGRSISVSAERGYLRESGNLIFHIAIMGVLLAVGLGGGFGYNGQKIVVQGHTFVNALVNYDSFNPGRFFNGDRLSAYSVTLDHLAVDYETKNKNAIGQALDYTAEVTTRTPGDEAQANKVKVNEPLHIGGTNVYLLGNGYAPVITVRGADGKVAYRQAVPFLPQDNDFTSLGVVKIADGLPHQIGMIGFFYPTAHTTASGAMASSFPGLRKPMLTLNVYRGNLGIDDGAPKSVYSLDTNKLTQLNGPGTGAKALQIGLGQTVELPNHMGTVTLDGVKRYASFTIDHNPAQVWVLISTIFLVGGLLMALLVPRRRMWVKAIEQPDGGLRIEYAGLARGEDPRLLSAVEEFAESHLADLGERGENNSEDPSRVVSRNA